MGRINVAGLMARLQIKDGPSEVRWEHVKYFIETLDDRDLADHLALLRIPDADTWKKHFDLDNEQRQRKAVYVSIQPHQKKNNTAVPSSSTLAVRAVKVISDNSESEEESSGSDGEAGLRRVYLAASGNNEEEQDQDNYSQQDRQDTGSPPKRCSHCGGRKHSDLGCLRRLTCEKCGRKGHPLDRCLFTCKACGDVHKAGKCTMEEFYNLIRQWYNSTKHAGMLPETAKKIYCIYAYVEKQSEATVNQLIDPIDNTCHFREKPTATVANLHQIDEYARSIVMMALEVPSGESRGYWKYHVPDKKFKQSKAMGRSTTKKQLCYSTVVSKLDATYARKVGCHINERSWGISFYNIEERSRLDITLAGSLVYFFEAWDGPPTGGQDLILGLDFMVPAGIRLDLADGTICLPDEVRLQMAGRRPLYGDKIEHGHYWIVVGQTAEIRLSSQTSNQYELWVTRGDRWVPTITVGPGKTRYLRVTNVSDRALTLHEGSRVAMWLSGDRIPRIPGASRRNAEWQNLAYQATTTDEIIEVDINEQITELAVERPEYVTPTATLPRPAKRIQNIKIA
ncbi:LOW QUALITY PROTEIN: Hypothetical protein PHPALM_13843 [Phytophthora palmivora]|uniref:CCHC-type domain-containing protein n=1 Tax=Phytophthora palmivora TaxID=4796 RepID=A0A2P4XWA1_9STRA|nr:LOW QUALITY PROTEIN: Hypothetical protein PHPALM_13843 [Phytophthora palmivora]